MSKDSIVGEDTPPGIIIVDDPYQDPTDEQVQAVLDFWDSVQSIMREVP